MNESGFEPDRERAFVAAFLAGDRSNMDRWTELLSCVPRMVHARNQKLAHPLPDDELRDVIQDTFLAILRGLPAYRPEAPLTSWIHGICCLQVKAAARARARARARRAPLHEEPPEERGRSPSELLEDAGEVHAMLAELGGIEADVIRMKHLQGLTFAELGARLGVSPNTLKASYYRGLSTLRRIVERRARRAERRESV